MISVLTIAGSDCLAGAGAQADLKVFSTLGLHGATVITCVVAENTRKVSAIRSLPLKHIAQQIDLVVEDLEPRVAKIGMLYRADIVSLVAKKIKQYGLRTIVDPVMLSTTGASLIKPGFVNVLKAELLPLSLLVTPNLYEAKKLTGFEVKDLSTMRKACKKIGKLGCEYVLVKGGHLRDKAIDLLWDGKRFTTYWGKKAKKDVHGSGCTHSALIAGFIAKGEGVKAAVSKAKELIARMIEHSYRFRGAQITNHLAFLVNDVERYHVLKELKEAIPDVEKLPLEVLPEVGINLVYALPYAVDANDICAFDRISAVSGRIRVLSTPWYNKSKHLSEVILACMRTNRSIRSTMNVRYSERYVKRAEKRGLVVARFDRAKEPKGVSTMSWGTEYAIRSVGKVPDLIYDKGAVGKEPMIRVLGKRPKDVLRKVNILVSK